MEQAGDRQSTEQPRPTDSSVLRAASGRFAGTLEGTLRSAVVPYGYTVTIWASGAYLISLRGVPRCSRRLPSSPARSAPSGC